MCGVAAAFLLGTACCTLKVFVWMKDEETFFIRVDLQKKSCSSCCSESLIYVDKPIIIFYMLELSRRILREIENLIWRARQVIRTQVALVVSSMKLEVCCHNEWEKKWVIQNGKSLFVKKTTKKPTSAPIWCHVSYLCALVL